MIFLSLVRNFFLLELKLQSSTKIEIKGSAKSFRPMSRKCKRAHRIDYLQKRTDIELRATARRNIWIEIELRISQEEETGRFIGELHRAESSYTLINVTHAKFVTTALGSLTLP